MNMLMNGVNPVGMVYNQSAENIAYDSNNSVGDILDKFYDSTLTTSGLSPSSNVTINSGGYKQIGKFVYVNMTITITSLSQWSTAISGFPRAKKESPLTCCLVEPTPSTNIMLDLSNTNLRLVTNSISSSNKININGIYLAE